MNDLTAIYYLVLATSTGDRDYMFTLFQRLHRMSDSRVILGCMCMMIDSRRYIE